MTRLGAALLLDLRLQARNRLYAIGLAVALMMGLVGRALFSPDANATLLPAFYLVGLGGTTYMFGASMVLLDKADNTLAALRVTPLRARDYLLSKAISLTGFAILESLIVLALMHRGTALEPLPLILGVALLGLVYTYLGIGQVASHQAVTSFLIPGGLVVSTTLQLPFLSLFGIGPDWLWYLIPTQAPLLLMRAGFIDLSAPQWAYALAGSLAAVLAARAFALRRFRHHVHLREA